MAAEKTVNFVRFGEGSSVMEPITPADTPADIIRRVTEPLGLSSKGSYSLIHKESNVQLVNDVYGRVEDLDSVVVAPDEVGGHR